jgi:hypothetical protein
VLNRCADAATREVRYREPNAPQRSPIRSRLDGPCNGGFLVLLITIDACPGKKVAGGEGGKSLAPREHACEPGAWMLTACWGNTGRPMARGKEAAGGVAPPERRAMPFCSALNLIIGARMLTAR